MSAFLCRSSAAAACQTASDRRPNPVGPVQMRWHVWQDAEPSGQVNGASGESEKVEMRDEKSKNVKSFFCFRLEVRVLNSRPSSLTTTIRCRFQSIFSQSDKLQLKRRTTVSTH